MLKSSRVLLTAVSAAVALSACQTSPPAANCKALPGTEKPPDRTTAMAIGAAAGAVGGALIGRGVADNKATGTRNGALLGAVAGAVAGSAYASSVKVTQSADGSVKISVPGSLLFPTGSSQLSTGFKQTLDSVAGSIKEYCGVRTEVIGHTDNVGSYPSNKKLSDARAQSVVSYLSLQGVDGSRLSGDGRADTEPVASNSDESGRSQNRRVEIFVRPPA